MADTQTTNLILTSQTPGGNNNTWGAINNTNFESLDNVLGDTYDLSTTGGTTTLLSSQELVANMQVAGVLALAATMVFSGRGGFWIIENNTSGAFAFTAKVSGQAGVVIPQGESRLVFCDGTDIKLGNNFAQTTEFAAGDQLLSPKATAPTGWTKQVTHNDKALRVVSGTPSSGGSTPFSTVMAARTIAAANLPDHTVSITDTHTHNVNAPNNKSTNAGTDNGVVTNVWRNSAGGTTEATTGTAAGSIAAAFGTTARGGAQTAMDFAVQYLDCIVIEKDA